MYRVLGIGGNKSLLAAVVTSVTVACLPVQVLAQSLDAAVTQQLRTVGGVACATLRGADPLSSFQGGLLTICSRATGVGASPAAASAGGGAGTPTTVPGVVTRRMEAALGEEEETDTAEPQPDEVILEVGRWNVFFSGEYETLDRDETTFEDGFDSDISRLTVGADVRLTERSTMGAAFVGSDQSGDFDGGGDFDVDSFGVLVFGTYLPTDRTFIQFSAGYFDKSNERERVATFESDDVTPFSRTGRPDADFDADQLSAGILVGYDSSIGNVTFGPRAGLDWIDDDFGTYSEKGISGLELTFHDDKTTSLQSTIGLWGSVPISTGIGVVLLQGNLDWKHEFDQDQRDVEVSFTGDNRSKRFTYETEKPDRDFFEFSTGFSVVLPKGIQVYFNYRTLFDHKFFDNNAAMIGARLEL
jgi:outer membrane autotransporter protein